MTTGPRIVITGEVKNFLPENYMDKKKARRIGRSTQMNDPMETRAIRTVFGGQNCVLLFKRVDPYK